MTAAEVSALTVDEAVLYLLGRGLLTSADVVDGRVRARSAAYRHRHLRIERGSGNARNRDDAPEGGYVLKQIEPSLADADASFRVEECFYRRCRDEPRLAPLAPFLAPPCLVDADRRLLIFDLLAGARPLDDALADTFEQDGEPPAAPHDALGRALGTLHRAGADLVESPRLADLERRRPSVFTLHRPSLGIAARISGAQRRMLTILQEHPEIGRGLDAAAERWFGAATLVHGDVRSNNVLVMPPAAGGEAIRLIDWELLGIGDPAWDVAGALQDLLVSWIRGLPFDPALSGSERVGQAERPLASLHPLFAALRASYAAVAGDRGFDRAVPFSAVRLLQTAWEWAQNVTELPAPAVMMLQVSANVLADPERAGAELYGFSERGGA